MSRRTQFADLVLHKTDDLLVLNKPSGISSLNERNSPAASLLALARQHYPQATLCHRLDRDTSGVMLLALNHEAFRQVAMLFEKREVNKTYHAVCGCPTFFENTVVNLPIRETKKASVVIDRLGKQAETHLQTVENYRHHSLVACHPITGRMHQIRIHLASQHAPIAGDVLYGGTFPMLSHIKRKYKAAGEEQPIFKRVALHARAIQFSLGGNQLAFEAPYPDDLEVFLKLLRKYDTA